MELSSVEGRVPIEVVRDGDFLNLGFLHHSHERMLTFVESRSRMTAVFRNPKISAVLTKPGLANAAPARCALAVCDDPRMAFARLHNDLAATCFYWETFKSTIDPSARVHPTAWVDERNVRIGAGAVVGPQATILERCVVGRGVRIGAGCVLGGVGFQTVRGRSEMLEFEHAGGLMVGDRAMILPGAIIATGLFRDATEIGADARVGSGAFVSHGVKVGERAFVGHGAVLNGGVMLGKDAWIGPAAVVAQELKIGDGAFVCLGAAVIRDVIAGARVSGNFAAAHRRVLRFVARLEPDRTGDENSAHE